MHALTTKQYFIYNDWCHHLRHRSRGCT